MAESPARGRLTPSSVYALAFLSGLAALVYQVVWARMLSLTFGSSTVAASAVVGGFMGGMGVGAWLYQRVGGRGRDAMRVYGVLEAGIALSALALTASFVLLPGFFAQVAPAIPAGVPLTLFRIACVVLLLLVPAALMGATYPALCTALIGSKSGVDDHLGGIYGLNTLGAAGGALLGGLVLVEAFGLRGAAVVAAGLNLIVAVAAFALAKGGSADPVAAGEDDAIDTTLPVATTAVVLVGSGFATLSYEILWFRALRYMFGNSTYALSIMLVIFLLGLALGALLLRPVARRGLADRALGLSQLAIGVLAVAAMLAEAALLSDTRFLEHVSFFANESWARAWWQRLLLQSALSVAILLPAVVLMGLAFPLASRLYVGGVRTLGARLGGAVLLANTGSILGAIATAVFILPALGTLGGTTLVAVLNGVLGTVVLLQLRAPALRTRLLWVATGLALLGVGAVSLPPRLPFTGAGMDIAVGNLVFEEEGDLATVQVRERPGRPADKAMTIDGATIGVSGPWHYGIHLKQIVLAHLPLALDRNLRSTLSVGLGSASTLHALAAYPQIERLDAVEISGAVVRGARLFPQGKALADPRVSLYVEDVFHELLRSDEPYDLIISDGKQSRTFQGNAKILSTDFYEHAKSRLAPGGLLVQWIPLSSLTEDYRVILRTFASVFPHVEVFFFPNTSSILVGSREPILGREGLSQDELPPFVQRQLEGIGILDPAHLLAARAAGREALVEVVGEGPTNDWDRLVLEYRAYRAPYSEWATALVGNLELIEDAHASEPRPGSEDAVSRSAHLLRRAALAQARGDLGEARRLTQAALEQDATNRAAEMLLARLKRAERTP